MNEDSVASSVQSAGDPADEAREVREWLADVSGPEWLWYAKRLSANDTLLNRSHQAGAYLPAVLVHKAFPLVSARHATEKNPDALLEFSLDSHRDSRGIRLIWYNNRVVETGGTRNEARLTRFGGKRSPLLDPESTGSLCVFAFELVDGRDSPLCRVWLCASVAEESAVEDSTGPVEPGEGVVHSPAGELVASGVHDSPCGVAEGAIPRDWLEAFPSAADIVRMSVRGRPMMAPGQATADERLLSRRECEFEIFRSVEQAHVLPRLARGFDTVDSFVAFANAVTNRRKSRSGMSLELQARQIFLEDLVAHSHQGTTEGRKRPDFLFPSEQAYHDSAFPVECLRMLATKTTCKDRWRQVINEADRIREKHLLTLQEGVSPHQWGEMSAEGIVLVVPRALHRAYPSEVRPHLLTFHDFIRLVGTTEQSRG